MTTRAGAALTALHYRQQVALRAQAVRDAAALWRMFAPGDRTSWDDMVSVARPLVQQRHAQSSALGARYFEALAALETGRHQRAERADALPAGQIEASLAATGLVGVIAAQQAGKSPQAAHQIGFVRFTGGLTRLALMGGRSTIVASVGASKLATGWSRVTSGDACSFCSELAGQSSTPEAFAAHDHCSCTAEPIFGS